MKNESKATFFAVLAVLCWSTVSTAFKLSLHYLTIGELLFYSSTVSIMIFLIVLSINGKLKLLFSCSKRQYAKSICLGFLNPFFYYLILFYAYNRIPAQVAQPVNYSWALTLTLLSVFFLKQKLSFQDVLGIIIGYVGIIVIACQFDYQTLSLDQILGTVVALFSSVVWAFYWLFNVKEERDGIVCLCLSFCFAYPMIVVYFFIFETIRLPELSGIFGAVYIGIFEMSLAFIFWLTAMKLTDNTARISILLFFAPFISLFLISFFVGEVISIYSIVGLFLISFGLIVQKYKIKPIRNKKG